MSIPIQKLSDRGERMRLTVNIPELSHVSLFHPWRGPIDIPASVYRCGFDRALLPPETNELLSEFWDKRGRQICTPVSRCRPIIIPKDEEYSLFGEVLTRAVNCGVSPDHLISGTAARVRMEIHSPQGDLRHRKLQFRLIAVEVDVHAMSDKFHDFVEGMMGDGE